MNAYPNPEKMDNKVISDRMFSVHESEVIQSTLVFEKNAGIVYFWFGGLFWLFKK